MSSRANKPNTTAMWRPVKNNMLHNTAAASFSEGRCFFVKVPARKEQAAPTGGGLHFFKKRILDIMKTAGKQHQER